MLLAKVAVGLVQLVIAILFAVLALYIGFAVLGNITKNIDVDSLSIVGQPAFPITLFVIAPHDYFIENIQQIATDF